MSRSIVILSAVVLAAVTLFVGSFWMANKVCVEQFNRPTDDLEWLRTEFHLTSAEMDQVRALHEGYLPVCRGYCDQIAVEKHELNQLVRDQDGGASSELAVSKLENIARLRAECQAAMLQHFEAVSQAMPTEQGRRYLKEMRRLTLGSHEAVEESMSGGQGNVHDHH